MSKLYGTLQGCRGEATRCGTASSGIRVSAQSYDGSLITNMDYVDDQLVVRLSVAKKSSCCGDTQIFKGTLEELQSILLASKRGN